MKRLLPAVIALAALAAAAWLLADDLHSARLFLGRFHSLLVHFPIVFVLLAGGIELRQATGRGRSLDEAGPLVLSLALLSAIFAALTGYLLSAEGGFDEVALNWHLRLGVLVAVCAAVTLVCRLLRDLGAWLSRGFQISLGLTVVLVMVTGHLGGVLAHGPDYLTEYLPGGLRGLLGAGGEPLVREGFDPQTAAIYPDLVAPALEDRCLECHNNTRKRGGLSLESREAIEKGGDSGPVLIPGDPGRSELLRRVTLPLHEEDRMPPGKREPLQIETVELLRWWIEEGAPSEKLVSQADEIPFAVQVILDRRTGPQSRPDRAAVALEVPPPDEELLEALRKAGFVVSPIAGDQNLLSVRYPAGRSLGPAEVKALEPLATHITWLDLGGILFEEESASLLASLTHLTRLNLSTTNTTDQDLQYLEKLAYLEHLNLYGTRVGDLGLPSVAGLTSLRSLFLWQTQVTEELVGRLRAEIPSCTIVLGEELPNGDSEPPTQDPE